MADVSDPAILEAYNDVRSDKTATKWLKLGYAEGKNNKIMLESTGSGEDVFEELRAALKDDTDKAAFAYARVSYANDKESTREKFLFLTWLPENVGVICRLHHLKHCVEKAQVMRKARLSVQKADVKEVIRQFSTEVIAETASDIDEVSIVQKLRAAGGANYGAGR